MLDLELGLVNAYDAVHEAPRDKPAAVHTTNVDYNLHPC